jgi:hypothetical protein
MSVMIFGRRGIYRRKAVGLIIENWQRATLTETGNAMAVRDVSLYCAMCVTTVLLL